MDNFINTTVQGLLLGGVYSLVALGVVVIAKATKVFNIAHGSIMMLTAFFTWWIVVKMGLPVWVSLILVGIFSIGVALLMERLLMRPLVGRPMLIPFVVTLFAGLAISGVSNLLFGGEPRALPEILPTGAFSIGAVHFSWPLLVSFIVATSMFVVFVLLFQYTKMGLAMRAVAEHQVVSQSLGVNVKTVFIVSWIIGCLAAAIAGILLSSMFILDTSLGDYAIMRALPVLLLGGIESVPGCLVAAIIIGVVETFSGTYVDEYVIGFRELLPPILMVLILMIRPNGLFGLRQIRRI